MKDTTSEKLHDCVTDVLCMGELLMCMQHDSDGTRPTWECMNSALYGLQRFCEQLAKQIEDVIREDDQMNRKALQGGGNG